MRYRLSLFATLLFASIAAAAQDYPQRPVRLVVPYAAGGLPDTMTRLVTARLTELYSQQF